MNTIKRSFRAFVISWLTLLGIATGFAVEAPVRIMPLGDSLTSGISAFPVQGAYRNRLHTLLTNAGYNVDFVGTFTDSSNPGLPDINHQGQGSARIDQVQANLGAALNSVEDPDVVLLLIGTNDFWQNFNLAGVQTRLSNLIADIATRRPFAKIIVSSLAPRIDSATIEAQQVAFNAAIPGIVAQQVALGRQVSFVNMHAGLTAADINGDGVHPSATGFDKMGDIWYPAIAAVIAPQGTANPPVIARTGPFVNVNQVSIVFSKPVADSAANLANYSLSGGLTISNAVLDAVTKRTVTLTTSTQTPGIVYSLAVSGVRDRTAQQTLIAPGSMVNFSSSALINGSFEDDYTGWTTTGNQEIKSSAPYVATSGSKIAAFNTGQNTPNGTLSQTFATTIGQPYQLTFDVGAFGFNGNPQRILVAVQGSSSLVSDSTTVNSLGSGTTNWVSKTYNFTANSASTTLTFTDTSTTTNSLDLVLDNVRVGAQAARTLAVTSSPDSGASMTITPADNSSSGNGNTGLIRSYNNGTTVTVTAPPTNGGNNFLRWQLNGANLLGSGITLSITMDGNHSINAVYGSNNAPVASADAYAAAANTQLVVPAIGVLTNDSDTEGNPLTAVLNAAPLSGTLLLNPNGSFTYTPNNGFTGTDSFTYRASDGVSDSNIVTVSITVSASNSQLLVNGSFENNLTGWTNSGNMIIQSAAPYVTTNGSKLLAFNAGQLPANGVISQTFPTVSGQTYQLAFDAGVFAFNTNPQTIRANVNGTASLLNQSITINGIGGGNTRWVPQSFSFVADSTSTTLSFTDISAFNNSLDLVLDNVRVTGSTQNHTLTIASSPASAVAVAISPPDRNASAGGSTTFTRSYTAGAIVNLSAPASSGGSAFQKWQKNGADYSANRATNVTIDADMTLTAVYGINTAPVAVADAYATALNTPLAVPDSGVLGNDTDPESNTLSAMLEVGPTSGSLVLSPNGGFSYTPNNGFTGTDSFTYHATDGSLDSNIVTVNIVVLGGGPSALANGGFENGETGWSVTGNRFIIETTPPYVPFEGNKFAVLNGGNFTPDAVFSQTFATTPGNSYVLAFEVGAIGINTNEQKLGINLNGTASLLTTTQSVFGNGLNTPVWTSKSYVFTANSATTTLTFSDLSTNSGGIDLLLDNVRVNGSGAAATQALTVTSTPATGVSITVSPADNSSNGNGTTQFIRTYNTNAVVNLTAPATFGTDNFVKWQKNGLDLTTSNSTSVTMDAPYTLTAVYQSAPVVGTFANGSFESDETSWTMTGNRAVISTTPPYIPFDGTKLAVLNGINSTPNAVIAQTFSTVSGQAYVLAYEVGAIGINTNEQKLGMNLAGSSQLLAQTESVFANGANSAVWASKSYVFTADSTSTTLTFTDLSTFTIGLDLLLDNVRITPLRALTVASSPATGLSVTVSPNDADGNGNGTTQFVRNYPSGTVVTLTAPSISGASAFVKWQKNGSDFANTASTPVTVDTAMTLTAIYATNTAPTAVADSYTVSYETPLAVNANGVLGNDTDPETNTLNAVLDVGPDHGELVLNPNGGFTYDPDDGFSGSDSFTYHANDGGLDSNIVTVSLTVSPPNLIVNGGFENGETGWAITGNRFVIDSTPPYVPSEGSKFAVLNGGGTMPTAVFSQSFATTPGQSYILNFDIGIYALGNAQQRLTVALQGATTLLSQDEYLTGNGLGNSVWSPRTYAFTADSTSTTLSFTDNSAVTLLVDLMLDNVRVTAGLGRTLTVNASPAAALSITVSPSDLNSNGNGTTSFTRTYTDGEVVSLTAPATSGTDGFSKWQRNGVDFSNSITANVTMDANYTLTAVYAPITIQPGTLVNGSFENGFTGWTTSGNLAVQSAAPYVPTDGTKLASFNGENNTPNGVISQSFATTPGTSYTLAFDAGALAFNSNSQAVKVDVTGTGSLLSQTVTINGLGTGATRWVAQSFTFIANSATTTLMFTDVSASTIALDLVLDKVRVTLTNPGVTTRTLTVTSTPATGAAITVSPADNGALGNGTAQFTRTYNNNTAVTLTAPATFGGNNFSKWQKGGVDLTTNTTANVTMDADYTLTAVYIAPPPVGSFVNGSFESDFTGWTLTGAAFIESASPYSATNGSKLVSFNGGNQAPSGVLSQSFTTVSGTTYNVTFDMGVLSFNTSQQSMLVTAAGSANLFSQTFTINGTSSGTSVWSSRSFSFTADSTTTTLTFSDTSSTGAGLDMLLDNVAVVTGGPAGPRTLTVNSTPATGVAITVSPADNGALGNGTSNFTRTYNNGTSVTLTAPATFGGNNFSKWQKGGVDFAVTASTSVTMDADITMTAVYAAPPVGSGFVNGNFEAALTGWTTAGSPGTAVLGSGFSGTNSTNLVKFNSGNTTTDGVLNQTFTTTPGTTYTVTFQQGVFAFNTVAQIIQVSATGTANLLSQNFSLNGIGGGNVAWANRSASFTADSASTTLTFRDQSASGVGLDLLLDNVDVTTGGGGGGGGNTSVLTINTTPNTGAAITVSPADNSSQGNGNSNFTRTYTNGTAVSLVAPHANFVKWLRNGAWYATNPATTVTVSAATTMTAVYTSTPVLGPFTNGSFEQEFTGWTWSGSQQSVKIKDGLPSTDGINIIEFNSNSSANDGSISQTFTTTPGTNYTVNFDMGVLAYNTSAQSLRVAAVGSTNLLSQTFTMNGIGGGSVVWSARNVSFTANSSTTTLTFSDQSSTGLGLDLLLDNVRLTAGSGGGGGGGGVPSGNNLVFNGSFELSIAPQTYNGWNQSGSNRIEWPGPLYSTSGDKILSYSVGGTPPNGVVSQNITTVPGTTYQLDFDLGALGGIAAEQRLNVTAVGTGTLLNQTPNIFGPSGLVMVWQHKTFTFTANSTTTTLTFADASAPAQGMDMYLDSISVVALTPALAPAPLPSAPDEQPSKAPADEPAAAIAPGTITLPGSMTLTGEPGAYRISYLATEAGNYVLQRSPDLKTWNHFDDTQINEPGLIEFEDSETGNGKMFYRIGRQLAD